MRTLRRPLLLTAFVVAIVAATLPAFAQEGVDTRAADLSSRGPEKPPRGDRLGGAAPGQVITAEVVPTRGVLAIEQMGITVVGTDAGVFVRGTAEELRDLLDAGVVARLERVHEPKSQAVVSEGVPLTGADVWAPDGYTGAGIKVAVLDTGFFGYTSRLGDELPAVVTTKSFHPFGLFNFGDAHGTAVAEIVHDVAPDAELYLVNFSGAQFSAAVDWLIEQDVDVINMSAGWTVGPFDGTSPEAVAANRAIDAGIIWVNAAGNYGDEHFANTFISADADEWAEIAGTSELNEFTVAAGTSFTVDLTWVSGAADLDLCLFDRGTPATPAAPVELDCDASVQSPGDEPVAAVSWFNAEPFDKLYGFAVYQCPTGTPPACGVQAATRYDVFVDPVVSLEHVTPAGSLAVPADVERVISVGAVDHVAPTVLEPYSSRGPTVDGRIKPDLVAASRVDTATFLGPFVGTSSSAPHVAGIVAVYLSAYPGTTPVEMRRVLGLSAQLPPSEPPGKNSDWGWGLAKAGPVPPPHSFVGYQDPATGQWTLDLAASSAQFYYGTPSDVPVTCDWNGDTVDTVGLYRPTDGFLYLRNSNTFGIADISIFYGIPEDLPVCGDWDGDGIDTIGIYRPSESRFYLRNSNTQGFAELSFVFGNPGDVPFAGDWDGDGIDTIGLYRPSIGFVYIRNSNSSGFSDFDAFFGDPGDRFVTGDWDGDGRDSFGIYRPSDQAFYLSNVLGAGIATQVIPMGPALSAPVAGVWQ